VNPNSGWLSTTLKYEAASLKYPTTWKVTENTSTPNGISGVATPGSDQVSLISSSGLMLNIDTGNIQMGDSVSEFPVVLSSQAITTLGGKYYLDFYQVGRTDKSAEAACVGTTQTNSATYPASKNIKFSQ